MDTPTPSDAPEFSVVIAALNEAENIGAVIDEIPGVFDGHIGYEIVVVDDGSTDATAEVVRDRASKRPNVRLVQHAYRRGKSAALHTGAEVGRGRFMLTMDADGQDDPRDALKLAQAVRSAPAPALAAGVRQRRLDGVSRLIATRLANGLRRSLLNDDCPDTGCGLKAFERELFLQFPNFEGLHRFLPALAKAHGRAIINVPVEHRERMHGSSKYTNLGRAAVGVFDLLGVAWLISRTRPQIQPPPTLAKTGLSFWTYALLALVAFLMFAPGQHTLPPFDRDESRYAQATAQMLESGDFVDIRFQDEARWLQPAGIYWLQAGAVSAFSNAEAREIWANRLPSLISAIIAVLLTAWIGAMTFGRAAGVIAALGMTTCLLLNVEARMAKIDATLLAVTLTAQGLMLHTYLRRVPLKHWQAILFWAALGAGVMLKGPIIFVIVGLTALMVSVWDRKAAWLGGLKPYWIIAAIAVCAPWLIAISVQTHGAFFQTALGHSMLDKVGHAQQGHSFPPGYHLLMFPLMFWPGAVFAVLAAPWVWKKRNMPQMRFLISWIIPTWIFFELVATKLPHYTLPAYPAIAVLTAAALAAGADAALKGASKWIAGLIAAFVALIGLVLCAGVPALAFQYDGARIAAVIAGAIAGVLWLWLCARLLRGRRDQMSAVIAALCAVVLLPVAFGSTLPSLQTVWLSRTIDHTFDRIKPCPHSTLVSAPYAEPSMVFLVGTGTVLAGTGDNAARAVEQDTQCRLAMVAGEDTQRFLITLQSDGFTAARITSVSGRNYSNGRNLTLEFYSVRRN
ncbi:MAG TPA: glycosyltransferase [Caulobacterales bacterium]|nr:glycosyltransferase [Caulobacterales bacterium]